MSDPVFSLNQSIGGRFAVGASVDVNGDAGLAGDVTASGYGLHVNLGNRTELNLDPQIFASGNVHFGDHFDDHFSRTTLGGGAEISFTRDIGVYSPVLRVAVGGGVSIRHSADATTLNPAVRAALSVDVPIIPLSSLSLGLWLTPQIAWVDDAAELTLGVRGTLPTGY